jgi:SAM-dependent methyltransferase
VSSLRRQWAAAAALIEAHRDVLDARPGPVGPPHALVARGWASFLTELDDDALSVLEIGGLDAPLSAGAPPTLRVMVDQAREIVALPSLVTMDLQPRRSARRRETPRKRAQIDAFAELVLPLTRGTARVIDVGSGHGHLSRELADRIDAPVVGLERDEVRAARARSLTYGSSVSFAVTDVVRDGIALGPEDCVVGLHACGELGDLMVERAAASGASVALVSCCLQKRSATSRASLCAPTVELSRCLLGLSNLTARDGGVEASRAANLAARERRLALHRLLSSRGGPMRLGAEIDGLNRRAAHGDLHTLVARAFAVRGLDPPSGAAIDDAAGWARTQAALARRLSVPRALLARVLEVFVLVDRALHLEESGHVVRIGTVFDADVSARNLALAASKAPQGAGSQRMFPSASTA